MNPQKGIDEFLEHYGVRGMHWGVRRSKTQLSKGSEDYERSREITSKGKTEGRHTLSNAEIRAALERINLEQQYSRATQKPGVRKFVSDMMANIGKEQVKNVAKKGTTKAVGAAFGGALSLAKKGR